MNIENINGFGLYDLSLANVILGKNGSGKSMLLKHIEGWARNQGGVARYLSPKRGGQLSYEDGVKQAIAQNAEWLGDQRRRNQADGFRQQSVALFRRLERFVLLEVEREHTKEGYEPRTFDTQVEQLNTLLDRVKIARHQERGFTIKNRDDDNDANPATISSGEAELISLGIEVLAFVKEAKDGSTNFLLIDEPDVHLHPDLQNRLAAFLLQSIHDRPVVLVLATHSTALLAALAEGVGTRVAFMSYKQTDLHQGNHRGRQDAAPNIWGASAIECV